MSPTLDLAKDYFHFVMAFFEIISISASHIYISALPLSPQTSIVYKLYKQYACPLVRVVQGLPISWDVTLATIYGKSWENSVTWSPCGRFIAIARYGVIEILDGATLECLNTFESPKGNRHEHLLFSPDGSTLTQYGGADLICWDLQTGVPVCTAPISGEVGNFRKPSFAYSTDGRIFAVVHYGCEDSSLLTTYDLFSGTHICSYPPPEGYFAVPLWTHDKCLYFLTVKPGSTTIWEAAFTSVDMPAPIETLPTPDEITDDVCHFLFLPALSYLAFYNHVNFMIFIWDAVDSRFLLKYGSNNWGDNDMSFSSDGHFFSHTSGGNVAYVWRRSLDTYILHQKVVLPLRMTTLVSPDGGSIIAAADLLICLWNTREQSFILSKDPATCHFLLEFSPNRVLAASVPCYRGTVTIFNTQSGDPQLIIDTEMRIEGLRITESTIVIASNEKAITWEIPTKDCVHARVGVTESVHTTSLRPSDSSSIQDQTFYFYNDREIQCSISPDCNHIAILVYGNESRNYSSIKIYDTSTGIQLADAEVSRGPGSVALKECGVWYIGEDCDGDGDEFVKGWKIIRDSKSSTNELEPLEATMSLPEVFPWQSCLGYEVTRNGWVLSPTKKRLLWLPHHWRSTEKYTTWNGQFLGLIHEGLPEPVILEFLE